MELPDHGIARSRVVVLVAGFAISALLIAALILNAQSAIDKPRSLATAAPDSGWGRSEVPEPTAAGLSHPTAATAKVSSLQQLLPGLEAKVAANPRDVDLQILLAQTYVELGQELKGQELMDRVHRNFPDDGRVPFARAKMLMTGKTPSDLRRAIHLFEESALNEPKIVHLARLHQGQILLKLGDRERAIQVWRDYIATLPAGDDRRSLIEAELAHIPSG